MANLTDLVVKDAIREELQQCSCKLCNAIVETLFMTWADEVEAKDIVSEILLEAFIAHIAVCKLHNDFVIQE